MDPAEGMRQKVSVVGGIEGGRRPTEIPPTTATNAERGASNPEVAEKPLRRRFTAQYKLRILDEADRCQQAGQLGALLRREGLYSSHLNTWRKQRQASTLQGLAPKKRGRKATPQNPLVQEAARLARENEKLRQRLHQAEIIIECQKKLSEILGIPLPDTETIRSDD